jgi:hypothetical protein
MEEESIQHRSMERESISMVRDRLWTKRRRKHATKLDKVFAKSLPEKSCCLSLSISLP